MSEGVTSETNQTDVIQEMIEQATEENENKYSETNKNEKINFHGRQIIYCSLKKDELTPENIIKKFPEMLSIHFQNVAEIDYLDKYYRGIQPILNKTKTVRPDINNKVLVNHAYEIVEFKKSYVFGDPVQYVQKGEKDNNLINPEIALLNKFMESEDKSSKDKELAEWQYKIGTAYRWAEADDIAEEDDAPFEISIPDPRKVFVVYSTGINREQLFSVYIDNFTDIITTQDTSEIFQYQEYMVYLEDKIMVLTTKNGSLQLKELYGKNLLGIKKKLPNPYNLLIKGHRIIEYPLNPSRLGLIELVITQLNSLNTITSNEIDDIEQFVQSLLVYVNQEVDLERHKKIIKLGAVEINSQSPEKPADLKLLSQKIMHSETKVLKESTYNDILTIVGIPRLNDKPSGGDTGQARLLGEGWTMADERAKQDELSFKKSERQFLKLILNICKEKLNGKKDNLKKLSLSDIDIKFTRNKSDNILVKTQALMNLMSAQCPPDIAFTVVGLFNDPNEVFEKAKNYYGEKLWKKEIEKLIDNDKTLKKELKNEQK
ncbi:MAG: phage portal protein [Clostridia bacterium]